MRNIKNKKKTIKKIYLKIAIKFFLIIALLIVSSIFTIKLKYHSEKNHPNKSIIAKTKIVNEENDTIISSTNIYSSSIKAPSCEAKRD